MTNASTVQTKTTKHSLPSGWHWAKVGSLCNLVNGDAYKPSDWSTDGTKIIRIQNLNDEAKPFNYWAGSLHDRVLVKDGDILLAWSGTPGTSFGTHHWQRGNAVLNQHIFRVDLSVDHVTPAWFVIATNFQLHVLISRAHGGVGLRHVNRGEVEDLEIPIPPLDEQRRIAGRLNEQLAAVESARKAAEDQLEAAYQLPSLYLREVFDNHTANKWTKVRLGEILNLRKEVIHPHDNPKGPAVFVGLEHIESNTGVRIGSVDVEMSKLTGRKPKFYKGDIVYGYLRPYLNKVWIAEFDGLCSVDQYIYKVDDNKADTNFVAWFMRSPVYLERAPIDTTPGQLPRIRTEEVASVEINLPLLDEQRKIALQISEKLSSTNYLINTLEIQLAEIESLPASLLREAFAGQL